MLANGFERSRYLDSLTDGLVRPEDRKGAEGNLASISDSMSIYLHGLEMTFEGNFLDALHYLRRYLHLAPGEIAAAGGTAQQTS